MRGCLLRQMPGVLQSCSLSFWAMRGSWMELMHNKKSLILTVWSSSAVSAGRHFAAQMPSSIGIL